MSETEISRNNNSDKINNIQGILKVHSVKVVKPDVAAVRELACFCGACMDNQPDQAVCENRQYVLPWRECNMCELGSTVLQKNTGTGILYYETRTQ